MTGATFRAEVYGGDAWTTVFLGGLDARNPRRALRWLRVQAHRFADALDLDPFAEWVPPQALQQVTDAKRNAPSVLRSWADDNEHQGDALHQLNAGRTFEFVADDDVCWYALTAHPLITPVPAPFPAALAHA
ncbi:hypothetical protein [Streptomyces formicae]|uniref:Uncharacterized protein n=1 Tax=Streptomyces formicae TaxID=1616117 RepID=A0ABY3WLH0_9ACTN|nr:hypothetical protein [Streptomyces formicae]UNM10688.1 hypothetical protein J4032_03450 [Streptomyces formicae]